MEGSGDAVGMGLVESLDRPGGNVTGMTAFIPTSLRSACNAWKRSIISSLLSCALIEIHPLRSLRIAGSPSLETFPISRVRTSARLEPSGYRAALSTQSFPGDGLR